MALYVCAARDAVAESFGTPFFVTAKGLAIRSFVDEVNNADSSIHRHASDYTLHCIGTFDPASGVIVALDFPELLMSGDSARAIGQ